MSKLTSEIVGRSKARYYDHALNQASPSLGDAMAKSRRDFIRRNKAYTAICQWPNLDPFWWNGSYYDALGLCKDLVNNGGSAQLLNYDGEEIDIKTARY